MLPPAANKIKSEPVFPIPPMVHGRPSASLAEHGSRLNLDAGPHRGGHRNALDISAFRARRLCFRDRVSERLDVLDQLLLGERGLADSGLHDAGLLDPEFHRTAL